MKTIKAALTWLRGKWTYIIAGAIALATLAGVFLGKVNFEQATWLLGFAGAVAGVSAKIDRHGTQIAAVVSDVAKAGTYVAGRDYSKAEAVAVQTVEDSVTLATAVAADKG